MTGARALVVSPAFFGYENDIVAELERQGYMTQFVDERPSNRAVVRAVLRVRKDVIKRRIDRHFRRVLAALDGTNFDVVVVIKGEVLPRWFLQALRARNPGAEYIFYAFDAIENSPNCLDLLDLFDHLVSFDRRDVRCNPGFGYLPLFYAPEFRPLAFRDREKSHRLTFIGTLHSGRYRFVHSLFGPDGRDFAFFFVQARWYFALTKYVTGENRHVSWREVSFEPLSRERIASIFRDSKAVLDMQRPGQSGLTMRTFEVLASGSILVTSNDAIRQEPFYHPDRVIVLPENVQPEDAERLCDRLDRTGLPLGSPPNFEEYSIEAFVGNLLRGGQELSN